MLSSIATLQSFKIYKANNSTIVSNVYNLPSPTIYIPIRDNAASNYANGTPSNVGITLYNTPTYISNNGNVGTKQSLNLVATSSQYLMMPNINMASLTSFSVSLWVKLGATNSGFANIWCISNHMKPSGTDTTKKYTWAINLPSSTTIRFEYARDGSEGNVRRGKQATISTGVWTHFVAIQRANLGIDIYLNGTLVVTSVSGQNTTTAQYFSWTSVYNMIGRSSYALDPYTNTQIDDFRFYSNVELSTTDITNLYNMKNNNFDVIN